MIDESHFVPRDLRQARALHDALVRIGAPFAQASGIIGWLITLPAERSEDPHSNATRRTYRRRLRELGAPPWESAGAAAMGDPAALLGPTGADAMAGVRDPHIGSVPSPGHRSEWSALAALVARAAVCLEDAA